MFLNHPDRLLAFDKHNLSLAKEIYNQVANLPIISPHGHCDPSWFSKNLRFPDPANLLVVPDHYIFRLLVSQGVSLYNLGVNAIENYKVEKDPKKIWKIFGENYFLFRGTPTAMWLDYTFENVFGLLEARSGDPGQVYWPVVVYG